MRFQLDVIESRWLHEVCVMFLNPTGSGVLFNYLQLSRKPVITHPVCV